MVTPSSHIAVAGQQVQGRSSSFRRPRPQSLFYRDLAASPSPGGGGQRGASPSWKDNSAGIDHLPPPPCATLEECFEGQGHSEELGGRDSDLRASSFCSADFKSVGKANGLARGGTTPRQDSVGGRSFGSAYSDQGRQAFAATSPLQGQKLQFLSPDWKGKAAVEEDGEAGKAWSGQAVPALDSVVRADEVQEWVTLFGFEFCHLNLVFREFEKCGPLRNYVAGPPGSNYVHLQFQSRQDAFKAFQKNGLQLNASIIVGVKPVDPLQRAAFTDLSPGFDSAFSPQAARKDVTTASISRPYYLNGVEAQGPQPLRPVAAPVRSAVSRLVDMVFGL